MSLRDNLNVLGKTQKSITFFSSQQKKEVTNIDQDGNKSVVTISNIIKFINSAIEVINKIRYKYCNCFLEYDSAKDNLINYNIL